MQTIYTYTYTHADLQEDGGQFVSLLAPEPYDFDHAREHGMVLTVTSEQVPTRKPQELANAA